MSSAKPSLSIASLLAAQKGKPCSPTIVNASLLLNFTHCSKHHPMQMQQQQSTCRIPVAWVGK